jgi:hypothetical protein
MKCLKPKHSSTFYIKHFSAGDIYVRVTSYCEADLLTAADIYHPLHLSRSHTPLALFFIDAVLTNGPNKLVFVWQAFSA